MIQENSLRQDIGDKTFTQFITGSRHIRQLIYLAILISFIQFGLFKLFYPFPDFITDSIRYLFAASERLNINILPVGYSKFLFSFHEITHSDLALIAFQYFFLEFACLYFFLTILYLFSPGKTTCYILFIAFFFNPFFLYLSNYVTNDSIFLSISLCWVCQVLWMLHHPKLYHLLTNAILIFLCFTLSINAYYYPIISIAAFILTKRTIKWKLAGIGLPFLFIVPFVLNTLNSAKELTGKKQFNLLFGWQVANNALYMYSHIRIDSLDLPSANAREINRISQTTFKYIGPQFDSILKYEGNIFIKESRSPLMQYYNKHYFTKDQYFDLANRGIVSTDFAQFGNWMITHNPRAFIRYFILPNVENYFFPPLEKLQQYNTERVYVSIQDWFDYVKPDTNVASKTIQSQILFIYPSIVFFFNILLLSSSIWLLLRVATRKMPKNLRLTYIFINLLLLVNFCYCVPTTPMALRCQAFSMVLTMSFALLQIELLDRKPITVKSPNGFGRYQPQIQDIVKA